MNIELSSSIIDPGYFYGSLGAYIFTYHMYFKTVYVSFNPGILTYYSTAENLEQAKTAIIAGIINLQNKIMPIKVTQTEEEQGK